MGGQLRKARRARARDDDARTAESVRAFDSAVAHYGAWALLHNIYRRPEWAGRRGDCAEWVRMTVEMHALGYKLRWSSDKRAAVFEASSAAAVRQQMRREYADALLCYGAPHAGSQPVGSVRGVANGCPNGMGGGR
jgi:predicted aconitase